MVSLLFRLPHLRSNFKPFFKTDLYVDRKINFLNIRGRDRDKRSISEKETALFY